MLKSSKGKMETIKVGNAVQPQGHKLAG